MGVLVEHMDDAAFARAYKVCVLEYLVFEVLQYQQVHQKLAGCEPTYHYIASEKLQKDFHRSITTKQSRGARKSI